MLFLVVLRGPKICFTWLCCWATAPSWCAALAVQSNKLHGRPTTTAGGTASRRCNSRRRCLVQFQPSTSQASNLPFAVAVLVTWFGFYLLQPCPCRWMCPTPATRTGWRTSDCSKWSEGGASARWARNECIRSCNKIEIPTHPRFWLL